MIIDVDQMPKIVFEVYSFLLDNTEVEPIVTREHGGRIKLDHASDRVQMTIKFRLNGRKWSWMGSSLLIDGEKKGLASSWEMYSAIFKDPDNGRRNFVPEGCVKAELPESLPIEDKYAPVHVSSYVKQIQQMASDEIDVWISRTEENNHLITAEHTSGGKIVFVFTDKSFDIRLISSTGYDITQANREYFEGFILEFLGSESRSAQVSFISEGIERTQGFVSNSVQVRQATVFRI